MGGKVKIVICFLVVALSITGVALRVEQAFAARGGGGNCTDASSPDPNDEEYFPFRFICGGDAEDTTNAYLQGMPGTPNGHNVVDNAAGNNYPVIAGNTTMNFQTGFTTRAFPRSNAGGTASRNVYVFTTIDIEDKMVGSLEFLPSLDNGAGGAIVERKYDACPGTSKYDTSPENLSDPDGKFPRGTSLEGEAVTTPGAVNSDTRTINPLYPAAAGTVGAVNASPYSTLAAGDALVDCGIQGRMLVWKINNLPENFNQKDPRLHFRLKISNAIPGGSDGFFCIRTNIGVQYPGYDYPQSLSQIAKKSQRHCYKVVKRALSGNITSSTENATGKSLKDVTVQVTRNCGTGDAITNDSYATNPAGGAKQTTDENGNYTVLTTVGQPTCLDAPGSTTTEGTSYNTPSPSGYNNNQVNSSCGALINCNGFSFIYNPIYQNPSLTKSASPGTNTDVKPGDRIDYTVTATNTLDANLPNMRVDDWIPLNMRQNAVIDSIELTNNNGPTGVERPSGWSANSYGIGLGVCPSAGTPLIYGDGDPIHLTQVLCAQNTGGPNSPPRIAVQLNRMPAYSTLTIKWHGFVKDAEDVGVYMSTNSPAAGTYCQTTRFYQGAWWLAVDHPEYGADYSQSGVYLGCQNKSIGQQAVTNWSAAQINNSSAITNLASNPAGSVVSNNTYHPIPGNITCVAKTAVAEYDPSGTGGGTACTDEVLGGVAYQSYLWSERTELPSFNETVIKIKPFPDRTKGPIEYYVRDQGTTGLSPNLAPQAGGYTPDQNHTYTLSDGTPGGIVYWGSNVNCRQRWPENSCATAGNPVGSFNEPEYQFRGEFNNANNLPYGSTITNNSRVCWREYWRPPALIGGYPEGCRDSNSISYRRVKVDQPFYDTALGGIHSGGGIGSSTSGPCTPQGDGGVDSLRNNPGTGKGWFMVSTTGNASSLSGISSILPDFTKSGADPQCRPDIAQRAQNLLSRPALGYAGPTRSSLSGTDAGVIDNNKIMRSAPGQRFVLGSNSAVNGSGFSNGSVGAPTTTLITKRWTLFVEGDLYIAGNVQYQDTTGTKLGASPSLGVVVTGNIYIDPSVTRLDGYYYAQGTSVGASGTNGVINTCSAQITGHPQAPANNIKTLSRGYKRDNPTDPAIPPEFGYTVSQCGTKLRVNGVMFGRSFRFNRVPQDSSGDGLQSEEVAYSNRLILSTPPAFSDLAAQFVRTTYQGENRPRY